MANGKAGRPVKEIGRLEFEKLCALQCTQQEICSFFDVDHKTLTKWCRREYRKEYSQVYAQKREVGKISLRRTQFKHAEKSAAMAIFLGKNYLGQTDGVEQRLEVSRNEQSQLVLALKNVASAITDDDADMPEGMMGESQDERDAE